MRTVRAFLQRLAGTSRKRRHASEIDAELESHVAMHVDDAIRAGMSPEEARRDALIRLGGLAQTRERMRERRSLPFLDVLAQDLRYVFRTLRRSPAFTAVAIVTLALGIGADSAVFTVVNAVLLQPLPYPDADRIVVLTHNESWPDLQDIAARTRSFAAIAGVNVRPLDYTAGDHPVQIVAGLCAGPYLDVFGVRAARGRLLAPADDHAKEGGVAVVSHAFWQGILGGDPRAVGRAIPLSGNSYTIVGILPEEARFPEPDVQVWLPLSVADPVAAPVRGVHFLHAALRLRRRSTIAAGRAEIAAADRWLERNYPEENRARRRSLEPLRERLAAGPRRTLLILFGAVGLVLLIACANFAGLLLARASARRREMAIRGSLGAGAGRLVRQLLTESVVLALLGGIAGLAAAKFGVRALAALPTGAGNGIVPVRIDGGVFAFATGVAAATGLIFGLVPALSASRYDFASALRDSARGSATRHELRLRRVLVVAEVALALVLLAGAGLLIRTLRNLRSVPPGFRAEHLLTFRLELPAARYESLDLQRMFRDRVTAALDALPGTSAALVSELPMSGEALPHNLTIAGRPPVTPGDEPEVLTRTVSDGYFRVLGIPIRRGRALQPADRETAPQVVVVNESFVRAYFPSGDPVGARIRWSREAPPRWMTIVGVVGDVNHFGPARGDQPAVYGTWAQATEPWKRWMYVVVRSTGDEASLLREATNRIGALDPQLPLTKVRSMEEVIDSSVSTRRFDALLLSVFALLALALASVGIYGLISYSVAQRRHDIGVRMALGADAGAIVRLIVGDGVRLAAAGAAIGLAGALLATRLMESLLFGVGARDPATLGAVIAVLTAVAAVASWIPARSATKVDPAVALRVE